MTIPLFPTPSDWVAPDSFPNLSNAKEIAIDLETCDPNMESMGPGWPRNDGFVVGYAIAVDGWSGYFPIAHAGGGNLDKRLVHRWLTDVLATNADKIMHNAAYDLGWLRASGFKVNGRIIDTMLAAPIIDENRFSFSLNSLGFDYLKEIKSEQGLKQAAADFGVHPKKELWKLPAMYVGNYAEQDAALTLKLWHYFQVKLRQDNVESIFDLETRLFPVLQGITERGIRFDRNRCEQTIDQLVKREKQLLQELKSATGKPVDIWAAASIANAFDTLGVAYPRTEAGAPSFTKTFLEECSHPIGKTIIEARETNKTHSTFLRPYLEFSAKDGRIHPHINQMRSDDGGTVTGRLSMANPNLQQVPARHEIIGPMVRGLFLPEEGELWASNDFSSQEPRILIHYASLLGLPGVDSVVEAYKTDPDTDFYQIVANAAKIPRKTAKTCIAEGQLVLTNLGLIPIEDVTPLHMVWDGVEWVSHDGVVFMGIKEVITYGNLTATPDHDVWTIESGKIPFGIAASRLDALVSTGNAEQAIQYVDSYQQRSATSWKTSVCESAMQVWERGLETFRQFKEWKIQNVSPMHYAGTAQESWSFDSKRRLRETSSRKSGRDFSTLHKSKKRRMEKLRRTWDKLRVFFNKGTSGAPYFIAPSERLGRIYNRQNKQRRELYCRKYTTGNIYTEQQQSKKFKKVFDIINAGPRHRFTVSGVLVSNCSLGMMYGMGKGKLANQLDLSIEEASSLIDQFHKNVPFLKGTVNAVMRQIEKPVTNGAIRTLLGRKCRFPLWEPMEWGVNKALPYEQALVEYGSRIKRSGTYKGLNRLIQGSAADQTKAAMIALHESGENLLLQVHDEVVLSVKDRAQAERAAEIMVHATELVIPTRVDVEVGENWGSAK